MASLRNAMKRRTHKERHQPAKRAKRFGLLEKKKDYVVRARDYRRKQGRLRILKEKAAQPRRVLLWRGEQARRGESWTVAPSVTGRGQSQRAHRLMRTQDAATCA